MVQRAKMYVNRQLHIKKKSKARGEVDFFKAISKSTSSSEILGLVLYFIFNNIRKVCDEL